LEAARQRPGVAGRRVSGLLRNYDGSAAVSVSILLRIASMRVSWLGWATSFSGH